MSAVWTTHSSEYKSPFFVSTMSVQDNERLLSYFDWSSDEDNEIFDARASKAGNLPEFLLSDTESAGVYVSTTESELTPKSKMSESLENFKRAFTGLCRLKWGSIHVTVEPVVFLYFMGASMTMPLTQQLLYSIISYRENLTMPAATLKNSSQCIVNVSDPEYQSQQEVQATASIWMMAFVAASTVPAFLTTLFLGAYSDQTGRKLGLMIPTVGSMIRALWSAVVLAIKLPPVYLLIGVIADGLSGGIGTMTMSCFAYISDVTTTTQRSMRIVIIEITIALGVTISQVLSGYLITFIGFEYAFIVVLMLYIIILVYAILLPETVVKHPGASLVSCSHLKAVNNLYANSDKVRTLKLFVVLVLLFLTCTAEFGTIDVLNFTLLNTPLCWNSTRIGNFFAVSCALRSFGSISATAVLSRYLKDQDFVTIACVSALLYNILLATAINDIQVYLAPLGGILSLLSMPMIRAFASKLVLPQEQGTLFASIAWMQLLAVLVGDLSFNAIYSQTLALVHGFVFYVVSAILALALTISLYLRSIAKKEYQREGRSINTVEATFESLATA